jgi:hypothetical protein
MLIGRGSLGPIREYEVFPLRFCAVGTNRTTSYARSAVAIGVNRTSCGQPNSVEIDPLPTVFPRPTKADVVAASAFGIVLMNRILPWVDTNWLYRIVQI